MEALTLNRWNLATLLTWIALSQGWDADAKAGEQPAQPLRAGMIGLDTSHVPAFARLFNNPKATSKH
ncbi:MAG: hypothetical protein AAB676_11110 [Verrucomicrobiota bacterium]